MPGSIHPLRRVKKYKPLEVPELVPTDEVYDIGVDESGRSAEIGGMPVAAVAIPRSQAQIIKEKADFIKDSKNIDADRIADHYAVLRNWARDRNKSAGWYLAMVMVKPKDCDENNLNDITLREMINCVETIARGMEPWGATIRNIDFDAVGDCSKAEDYIRSVLREKGIKFEKVTMTKKADVTIKHVSAASIVARYWREVEKFTIREAWLKFYKEINENIGKTRRPPFRITVINQASKKTKVVTLNSLVKEPGTLHLRNDETLIWIKSVAPLIPLLRGIFRFSWKSLRKIHAKFGGKTEDQAENMDDPKIKVVNDPNASIQTLAVWIEKTQEELDLNEGRKIRDENMEYNEWVKQWPAIVAELGLRQYKKMYYDRVHWKENEVFERMARRATQEAHKEMTDIEGFFKEEIMNDNMMPPNMFERFETTDADCKAALGKRDPPKHETEKKKPKKVVERLPIEEGMLISKGGEANKLRPNTIQQPIQNYFIKKTQPLQNKLKPESPINKPTGIFTEEQRKAAQKIDDEIPAEKAVSKKESEKLEEKPKEVTVPEHPLINKKKVEMEIEQLVASNPPRRQDDRIKKIIEQPENPPSMKVSSLERAIEGEISIPKLKTKSPPPEKEKELIKKFNNFGAQEEKMVQGKAMPTTIKKKKAVAAENLGIVKNNLRSAIPTPLLITKMPTGPRPYIPPIGKEGIRKMELKKTKN